MVVTHHGSKIAHRAMATRPISRATPWPVAPGHALVVPPLHRVAAPRYASHGGEGRCVQPQPRRDSSEFSQKAESTTHWPIGAAASAAGERSVLSRLSSSAPVSGATAAIVQTVGAKAKQAEEPKPAARAATGAAAGAAPAPLSPNSPRQDLEARPERSARPSAPAAALASLDEATTNEAAVVGVGGVAVAGEGMGVPPADEAAPATTTATKVEFEVYFPSDDPLWLYPRYTYVLRPYLPLTCALTCPLHAAPCPPDFHL